MLTILEGPDGGGKTSLLGCLERRCNIRNNGAKFVPFHNGPAVLRSGSELTLEYLTQIAEADPARSYEFRSVVIDRTWFSEDLYGPVMRRTSRLNVPQRRAMERLALALNARLVFCLPSLEACLRAWRSRKSKEYLPDEEKVLTIYKGYEKLARNYTVLPTYFFNYQQGLGKVSFLDLMDAESAQRTNVGPGTGAFRPGNTLIVGEQAVRGTTFRTYPWVSYDPSGCTFWLSQQLETWGVPEDRLYWINAMDERGYYYPADDWLLLLKPKQVVALGTVAEAWCKRNAANIRCPVHAIQHPQYWKRFKPNESYEPLQKVLCS